MRIPYSPAPSGEEAPIPYVELRVGTLSKMMPITALVDSGSGHNLFSIEVAKRCGVNLKIAGKAKLGGYKPEDKIQQGIVAEMNYELLGHKWTAETIFVETGKEYGLLGQLGFFDQFDVTFRLRKNYFEIERKR